MIWGKFTYYQFIQYIENVVFISFISNSKLETIDNGRSFFTKKNDTCNSSTIIVYYYDGFQKLPFLRPNPLRRESWTPYFAGWFANLIKLTFSNFINYT